MLQSKLVFAACGASLLVTGLSLPQAMAARDIAVRPYTGTPAARFYADVQWGIQAVRHSNRDFLPNFASVGGGVWLFDNIGFDLFYDSGVMADDTGVFALEIDQSMGMALRFQSPRRSGVSAFITLGYVDFTVEQHESDARGQRTVMQNFGGVRASLGFNRKLQRFPAISLTAEYRNYYSDKDLQADSLGIGLRMDMQ